MAEIDFADGFDVPEPLVWGLSPSQLGVAVTGGVLAYLVLRSPLPRVIAVALAALAMAVGLTLALARRDGRTLIAWVGVAARFWMHPRHGLLVVTGGRDAREEEEEEADAPCASRGGERAGMAGAWVDPPGSPNSWVSWASEVEISRRVPLVLLPESIDLPPVPPPGTAIHRSRVGMEVREVADTAVLSRSGSWSETETSHAGAASPPAGAGLPGEPGAQGLRTARRLVFYSLSGGTGRTTLAVEVAGLLAGRDRSSHPWGMAAPAHVALVDLDLLSPCAGIRLGVPATSGWDLAGDGDCAHAVGRMLAVHRSGLRVLPGPARLLPAGTSDRPEAVRGAAAAVAELERRGCDIIVLDVAGDLSALTRWALESAHDIFVVLTPTAGGVLDAYRTTEALRRLGLRHRIRYVVNRFQGVSVFVESMLDLGGSVVAEIPDDPDLENAETDHRLVGLDGSGPTAAALRALAATADARLVEPPRPAAHRGTRRTLGRGAV